MTVLSDRVDALEATNATLVDILNGLKGTLQAAADAGQGPAGWSPVLTVQADGDRLVYQITDWTGGGTSVTKPDVGEYIGSSGLVATAAEAVDIRGATGLAGQSAYAQWEALPANTGETFDDFIDSLSAQAVSATASNKTDAETARDLAQKWASEIEDTEVTTGLYSALHHAAKAAADAALTDADRTAVAADASAVAAAKTAVEALFDNFDDRFLGDFTTALEPTTDNDGDPITVGAVYLNTDEDELRFWNGSLWKSPEATAEAAAAAALASQVAAALSEANAANSETAVLASEATVVAARDVTTAARDLAEVYRDTALSYKNTAAAEAANALSAVSWQDLSGIAESKDVVMVAGCVSDTPAPSLGVQKATTWYNETLGTATRGSRADMPTVMVVIATASAVTIYDGDDPNLPMWMVFNVTFGGAAYINPVGIACHNGVLHLACYGNSGSGGYGVVDFASDWQELFLTGGSVYNGSNIANRNVRTFPAVTRSGNGIVNRDVTTVITFTDPNAPRDPVSGLPIDVKCVGTAGGVSVILEDGTVYNDGIGLAVAKIVCTDEGVWWTRTISTFSLMFATWADIRAGNGFGDLVGNSSGTYDIDLLSDGRKFEVAEGRIYMGGHEPGGSAKPGLMTHFPNYDDQSEGLSSFVDTDHATGLMFGSPALVTMCEADDADLVESGEIFTSPTIDPNWTDNLDGTYSSEGTSGFMKVIGGLTVGETYVASVEIISRTSGNIYMPYDGLGPNVKSETVVGTHTRAFVAGTSTMYFYSLGFDGTVGSITVKKALPDRSVNGNGLIINGTVAKDSDGFYGPFTGSIKYFEQPYNDAIPADNEDLMIAFRVKMPTLGGGGIIDFGQQSAGTRRLIYTNGSGDIFWNNTSTQIEVSEVLIAGMDHHVAVCHDAATNTSSIFVDGELKVSGAMTMVDQTTDSPVFIGIYSNLSNAFSGLIKDLSISSGYASPEQIKIMALWAGDPLTGSSSTILDQYYDEEPELLMVLTSEYIMGINRFGIVVPSETIANTGGWTKLIGGAGVTMKG